MNQTEQLKQGAERTRLAGERTTSLTAKDEAQGLEAQQRARKLARDLLAPPPTRRTEQWKKDNETVKTNLAVLKQHISSTRSAVLKNSYGTSSTSPEIQAMENTLADLKRIQNSLGKGELDAATREAMISFTSDAKKPKIDNPSFWDMITKTGGSILKSFIQPPPPKNPTPKEIADKVAVDNAQAESGPTAINPKTGQRIRWDGKEWIPIR